ncbi:hypothetical protein V0288_16810 [Pannus brasiliensis CCIBt3594]|uniref:Uncharacterized protein n=1 Tax=Pannus brasiliensis CCIBt3594 TaxID=1427578 RepID=A0AAW9QU30_9CHRO
MVRTPTKPLTLEEFLQLPETEPAKRGLTINYDVEDFQADIKTLQSLGLP